MYSSNDSSHATIPHKYLQNNTKSLYTTVIDATLDRVREAFYDEGLDDQVLNELKCSWNMKLRQSGALVSDSYVDPQYTRTDPNIQNKLNIINAGIKRDREESSQPVTLTQHQRQSRNIQIQQQHQQIHETDTSPPQQVYIRASDGARVHIPRQTYHLDGQNDESGESEDEKEESIPSTSSSSSSNDIESDENENPSLSSVKDEEIEELNSDDDISDDEVQAFDCENTILCQFESVKRKQQKWTIKLSNGIMSIDKKDIVFTKLQGDAEW